MICTFLRLLTLGMSPSFSYLYEVHPCLQAKSFLNFLRWHLYNFIDFFWYDFLIISGSMKVSSFFIYCYFSPSFVLKFSLPWPDIILTLPSIYLDTVTVLHFFLMWSKIHLNFYLNFSFLGLPLRFQFYF